MLSVAVPVMSVLAIAAAVSVTEVTAVTVGAVYVTEVVVALESVPHVAAALAPHAVPLSVSAQVTPLLVRSPATVAVKFCTWPPSRFTVPVGSSVTVVWKELPLWHPAAIAAAMQSEAASENRRQAKHRVEDGLCSKPTAGAFLRAYVFSRTMAPLNFLRFAQAGEGVRKFPRKKRIELNNKTARECQRTSPAGNRPRISSIIVQGRWMPLRLVLLP